MPKKNPKPETVPKKRKATDDKEVEKEPKKTKVERAPRVSKTSRKAWDSEGKTFSAAARALGLPETVTTGASHPAKAKGANKSAAAKKKAKAEAEEGEKSDSEATLVMGQDPAEAGEAKVGVDCELTGQENE